MVKKDTPRAQLKPINDEFEPRPFRCPKCYRRCKNKGGLGNMQYDLLPRSQICETIFFGGGDTLYRYN